jgi:hypothetical protein
MFYVRPTERSWFWLPTFATIQYEDSECAVALIWLQLEVGFRWYPNHTS